MKENDSNTLQGHMYTYRFHMCMALSRDSTYSKHSIAENFVINVNKHSQIKVSIIGDKKQNIHTW